jgi:cytidine deaminase
MQVPSLALTVDDLELIEFARQIVDANTDGEDGVHTMGAAVRAAGGRMYGGINVYHFTGGPYAELVVLTPNWLRLAMPGHPAPGS